MPPFKHLLKSLQLPCKTRADDEAFFKRCHANVRKARQPKKPPRLKDKEYLGFHKPPTLDAAAKAKAAASLPFLAVSEHFEMK
jgi:hypothetical protein